MKFLIVLLLLVAAGIAVFVMQAKDHDPSKQGEDAKASISPGMSWTQVLDTAGEPKKYAYLILKKETIGGVEVETMRPSPLIKFDRDRVAERVDTGDMPHGFVFRYVFSRSVAFAVQFDPAGNVEVVHDLMTEADLFDWSDG